MTSSATSVPSTAAGPPEDGTVMLKTRDLHKSYGQVDVLAGVDFAARAGEFVCVVGPSGAGKTTLLKCISGLMRPTSGEVVFEGVPVTEPPAKLAVVLQDYSRSLMPWLTVGGNIDLVLRAKSLSRTERVAVIAEALTAVGLEGREDMYPWQMSGGMQQRVSIARGLAYQPDVLLMDEPFAAVDAQTRIDLEDLLLAVQARYDMTVLFVTHDIDEAVYLADRVIVLSGAPTTVTEEIAVQLPAPRDQVSTKTLPEYGQIRAHVFGLIRDAKATSRTTPK
ncbi:ATP-binding cassette domain-containing protein [Epidermidibacterium keratini]|uniref:ATP-binding cassette domain-containing protein n=1 Tax=Epidermidibacterium keratini TaxID=1891644 RepID=A0A7L4YQR8_9ACTN|nr:ABC transporter ATP-binding protein [Epidermidibacterium keratini]QHC01382.1 ATP-binding cassette domain-containing protein [Epidermidibacterium keratini]